MQEKKIKLELRKCDNCQKEYMPKRKHQRFHNSKCRYQAWKENNT